MADPTPDPDPTPATDPPSDTEQIGEVEHTEGTRDRMYPVSKDTRRGEPWNISRAPNIPLNSK